jgi:hypothetical protein
MTHMRQMYREKLMYNWVLKIQQKNLTLFKLLTRNILFKISYRSLRSKLISVKKIMDDYAQLTCRVNEIDFRI